MQETRFSREEPRVKWVGGCRAVSPSYKPPGPRGQADQGAGTRAGRRPRSSAIGGGPSARPTSKPGRCSGDEPPASPCRVGPRRDPEALRKQFRSQRREDGGGHAGEAGVCGANAASAWAWTAAPGRDRACRQSRGPGGGGSGGRGPGPPSVRLLTAPGRPGPRPGRRRLNPGSRSQGLRPRFRQLDPGGPSPGLPDPDVAEVHLWETRLPFPEAPRARPGPAVPKLTIQRVFLGRLRGAGAHSRASASDRLRLEPRLVHFYETLGE